MKKREISLENAKMLVATQFDIGIGIMGNFRSKSGNIYESKAPKEVRDCIVEFDGEYLGLDKDPGTIAIKGNQKTLVLIPVKDTVYSKSIVDSKITINEKLYVIALKTEDDKVFVPVVILRDEEKENFMMVKNLYGRANAIKSFYKLEQKKQEIIVGQLDSARYKRFESEDDVFFDDKQEQMLKYALTKETYTPDTQRTMEAMFKDTSSKHKVEQRQQYISRISPRCEGRIPVNPDDFRKKLDKTFYKMDRPKQQIKDLFASIERADKKGCNVLLVGPPGVGKTSLMTTIASIMNMPFESVPVNGLSCPFEIEGLDPGYDTADAGVIVKAFAAHGTSQMIICLDEFDKMNRNSKEGDPMNVFLRLFLGEHYDKFLQCSIKTENTVFIATANSVDNIPEAILNRFNAVIYLEEYSHKDKLVIAKKYIIPMVMKNLNIEENHIKFEDEAINCIIRRYCEDDGARDLKHNIERVIGRIISENKLDTQTFITAEFVESVLKELIEETPALYFSRNREFYSEPVAKEIKKCILTSKRATSFHSDQFESNKSRQKLEYLLACKGEKKTFLDEFDPGHLAAELHENLYGMNHVIKEVTNIYYTAYLQGESINSNLALCGGFGVGKSSIAKNIAKAMDYNYVKITLSGIQDIKELRGFSSSYVGSEPGRIMKGYKAAGSLRTVVQLDELDKLKPELAVTLLDLLDREFTDNFLDVPVDLTQSIFIATANEWSNVPSVIRDRFIMISIDGYSRSEKSQIVTDYIIPKLERSYATSGVSIVIDDEAEEFLLRTYATSFGVRDAEKAMQRICSSKLVEQVGMKNATHIEINKSDVKKYLGNEPIPRGNFPDDGMIPGIAKALAVCDGMGGICFAIETVMTEGKEDFESMGLLKESARNSVKIAVTCMKKLYPELVKKKNIYVNFGEGAVFKDGPSAGVALFMSIFSAAIDRPIMDKVPYDIAYTGELSLTGGVFAVGGIIEKIQAASDSGCKKVFIPKQNYERLEKIRLEEFECDVIPVTHITQVVDAVIPHII